jgi:hypothetical protein
LAASSAAAHPVPFTYLDLRLQPNAIEGTLVAHIFDLGHDLDIDPADRLLDPAVAAAQSRAIANLLGPRLRILVDGRAIDPQWSQADVLADRQSLRMHLRHALGSGPGTLAVSASLFPYDPYHQTFLNVYEGDHLTQAILDRDHARLEYFAGTRQGVLSVVRRFLPAGIQHIVIGPDHLLFLLGLLLVGGTLGQLALIATAFTVAHGVTSSLAAFSILIPPSRIIEPALALSIVYVGADNLLVRGGRDVRVWIAVAFGVIHGFGFAALLRDMDLSRRALGWSLVSINAGVEIGQLLVVVTVASALVALRSKSETLGRQLAYAGSLVVMAAGAFWFIQRVFFPGGIS